MVPVGADPPGTLTKLLLKAWQNTVTVVAEAPTVIASAAAAIAKFLIFFPPINFSNIMPFQRQLSIELHNIPASGTLVVYGRSGRRVKG
jgi:hypothetical protein